MRISLFLLAIVLAMSLPIAATARPISYPGGWTTMSMNDADSNMVHVNYTFTPKYSVGYVTEYWREEEWQFHGAQYNYLAKRWNNPGSQANFYLQAAAGAAHSDFGNFDNKNEFAGFAGAEIDWEDRRYFTSYENRLVYAGDIAKFFTHKARVGVAPYVGDYGDLHTWLMLQVDNNPGNKDEITVTPLVRFFKSDYLVEVGVNNEGNALINATLRF